MNARSNRGAALVIVLMSLVLMMALGAGLVLITSTETMIAANFRTGNEAFYAADAALHYTVGELSNDADWTAVLDGTTRSVFTDGSPSGTRNLADGSTIDLTQIANQANCQRSTTCNASDVTATTSERPWGANNPRWTVYAYGRLSDAAGAVAVDSPFYIVAFVGDDGTENDGDPLRDGADAANPGRGVIRVRAEAFGPRNAHKIIEATIARIDTATVELGAVRMLAWTEKR